MASGFCHCTLDAEKTQPFREYLADQADLVGAVRLPEGAFPDTDVVTDIIYLRKRVPREAPENRDWVEAAPHQVGDPGALDTHSLSTGTSSTTPAWCSVAIAPKSP